MILVRSPLRITLGGGGTDVPAYAHEHGGFCLTAAINHYVYVSAIRPFEPGIYLKYSRQERVRQVSEVRHPIFREALAIFVAELPAQIELTTLADIPAGTGLGSSSSFTTALVRALTMYQHLGRLGPRELADWACDIEIRRLDAPIGTQDQYAAAFGGILAQTIHPTGVVELDPLVVKQWDLPTLHDSLVLFYTGQTRSAGAILQQQSLAQLHEIKDIGRQSYEALRTGQLEDFGRLLDAHWQVKRTRSATTSNDCVDRWYARAKDAGALGGKLVGAGGGGFLLFYAEDPKRLRQALGADLQEVRFRFDHEGTKVLLT